jgi:putative ABC transport system ATP-binding protein
VNTIISLQGIRKDYPFGKTTIPALAGIDLELKAGRFYSIVGPSGSGKTSLLHILGCMDRPTSGRFFFQGRRVDECGEIERTRLRAKRIGFVFQLFHLNPILTAIENIAVPMQFLGVEKQAARRKASDYLDKVGMSHRRDHLPSELSGGERQRVAIARALVKQPLLLLAIARLSKLPIIGKWPDKRIRFFFCMTAGSSIHNSSTLSCFLLYTKRT